MAILLGRLITPRLRTRIVLISLAVLEEFLQKNDKDYMRGWHELDKWETIELHENFNMQQDATRPVNVQRNN